MDIAIRLETQSADEELRSLHTWLLADSDIRHNAEVRLEGESPREGEMGNTLDLITLIVTGSLAFPGFLAAIKNWRNTRRRSSRIIIRLNETEVVLFDDDDELILSLLERAQKK